MSTWLVDRVGDYKRGLDKVSMVCVYTSLEMKISWLIMGISCSKES